jgi:hypothetical protein
LPAGLEREWMSAMEEYSARPDDSMLKAILDGLANLTGTLIVLNHPFWLEEGVDRVTHAAALTRILDGHARSIHALELNGTRPWSENRDTISLACARELPVISGGDRHGCEPAACLNLSNAGSFGEFAGEVRDGYSRVLFLPQYQLPHTNRVLEVVWEALRRYPQFPGRERWTDRVFYYSEDGVARALSTLWQGQASWLLRGAAGALDLAASSGIRRALGFALAGRELA